MFTFNSFMYSDYISRIKERVRLPLSTRFKRLRIQKLRYLTILDRVGGYKNFLNFFKSIIHTPIYKRYPFTEKFAIYIFNLRGNRFAPQGEFKDKIYKCACKRMPIKCHKSVWVDKRSDRLTPFLEIKPDSFNDNIAVYLFSNSACCPECRIISYITNVDREGMYNKYSKANEHREEYILDYYVNLCRMSYQMCLQMYDGYEFWDDNTVLPGKKFDTYIDMFWKTYAFTILLSYHMTTDRKVDQPDLTLGGIGINWLKFNPDMNMVYKMETELLKYLDVLRRSFVLFQRHLQKTKKEHKLLTDYVKIESDYTFHDSLIEFLTAIDTMETQVLAQGIRTVPFSPFIEYQKYLNTRSKVDKPLPPNYVNSQFKKQMIDVWTDIKHDEPELIKQGYKDIGQVWKDIQKEL